MKFDIKKVLSIVALVGAGVGAIVAEKDKQDQAETIKNLVKEVEELKKK